MGRNRKGRLPWWDGKVLQTPYLKVGRSSGPAPVGFTRLLSLCAFGDRAWASVRDDESRHPAGRFFGKGRQAVRIAVQGDADVGVAQAFTYDLGMDPRPQSEGGVGMPEIM